MSTLEQIADTVTGWASTAPTWTWAALVIGTTAAVALTLPLARSQARKAGARAAARTTNTAKDRKERRLLIAVITPAVMFWLAVLAGSGRSLIAFGRDDLNWHGGWEWLVPATLDGVAVAFGALAFRAIAKERNPDRAYRVVWMATLASAAINFFHEINGSLLGAGYLAVLSLFGMLIFHELLAQFEEGAAWIKRTHPKFGLRWITWPTNTICAWVAWRNHPPEEGINATIAVAVQNLDTVRAKKIKKRAEQVDAPPWWTPMVPWVRVAQLSGALAEQRSAVMLEQRSAAESEQTLRAEYEDRITRLAAERDKVVADLTEQARRDAEQSGRASEQERSDLAERIRSMSAEHAAEVARLRTQLAERPTPKTGGAPTASRAKTTAPVTAGAPKLSDDEAVDLMLQAHPEPGYEWGSREVNRLTGAGFGRIPKLIAAVSERHAGANGARDRSTDEDDKERVS